MANSNSMNKIGRNSKLTNEVQNKLVQAIMAGNRVETACQYAGIGISTYMEWLQIAEGRHPKYKPAQKHLEFSEAIKNAIAASEVALVAQIKNASKNEQYWTAAAWLLERRFPERWSNWQKVQIEVKKEVDALFTQLERNLQPEVFEEVLRAAIGDIASDRPRDDESEANSDQEQAGI